MLLSQKQENRNCDLLVQLAKFFLVWTGDIYYSTIGNLTSGLLPETKSWMKARMSPKDLDPGIGSYKLSCSIQTTAKSDQLDVPLENTFHAWHWKQRRDQYASSNFDPVNVVSGKMLHHHAWVGVAH